MEPLSIPMDPILAGRLEALALLQQEALPGLPYDTRDAAHQALTRGLDLMLAEFLEARTGSTRKGSPKWHRNSPMLES